MGSILKICLCDDDSSDAKKKEDYLVKSCDKKTNIDMDIDPTLNIKKHIEIIYSEDNLNKIGLHSFEVVKLIGKGAYAEVQLVKSKNDGKKHIENLL